MTQMQTPRRLETAEFYEHKRRCGYRGEQWDKGRWEAPTVSEAEAVEQAFRMAEMCQKAVQRATRQLANLRLTKAKTARLRKRDRAKTIKAVKVA